MAEFIKIGNEITVKPKLEGISYELINNKVYDLEYDRMQGRSYLKENGDLNMPKKLYELEEDNKFIKRVLNYFNSENSGKTTGILLAGTKGTGKTMLSKRIALESNLPIIIVANDYPANKLTSFFKHFTTPVVVMFDEIEKNSYWWKTKDLLGFLDGVEATSKKLVLMTCNKTDEIVNFIVEHMEVKSFDNISAFLDEVVLFEDIPLDKLAKDMNLSLNGVIRTGTNSSDEDEIDEDII